MVASRGCIADADGLEYAGLQGYVGDHQNTVDYELRRARSRELLEPLVRLVERLRAEGLAPRIVSGGGTGTHDFDHELGVLTELQPGTYALMDVNYRDAVMRRDDPHPFGAALSVRATVMSAAQPGFVDHRRGRQGARRDLRHRQPVDPARRARRARSYSLVGDDMGRIEFANTGDRLAVGDVVELHAAALLPDARPLLALPRRAGRPAGRHLAGERARQLVIARVSDVSRRGGRATRPS